MDKLPASASRLLGQARRLVVFTGAGVSAESGVPTFRDDLTGLWARYDAQRLATPEAFHADPDLVWGWYEWRRMRARRTHPHPGHLAIAAIEASLPGTVVITQNVDLHERAGSRAPVHLHGSLFTPRCVADTAHTTTGSFLGRLGQHKNLLISIAISRDGRLVVTGSKDGSERVWTHAPATYSTPSPAKLTPVLRWSSPPMGPG